MTVGPNRGEGARARGTGGAQQGLAHQPVMRRGWTETVAACNALHIRAHPQTTGTCSASTLPRPSAPGPSPGQQHIWARRPPRAPRQVRAGRGAYSYPSAARDRRPSRREPWKSRLGTLMSSPATRPWMPDVRGEAAGSALAVAVRASPAANMARERAPPATGPDTATSNLAALSGQGLRNCAGRMGPSRHRHQFLSTFLAPLRAASSGAAPAEGTERP